MRSPLRSISSSLLSVSSPLFSINIRKTFLYILICVVLIFSFTQRTMAQDDNSPDAINPIIINFDDLPNSTAVSSQYPQVTFSSENNFYHPPFTWNNCGLCVTSSSPNWVTSGVGYDSNHELILDFKWPVKNLSFYIVGPNDYGTIGKIDIWENGTYARTVYINNYYGASYYPLFDDLSSFGTKITRIRIYNITDAYGIGFDDITFTPNPTLSITNPRVGGNLSGTTQNALIGADVRLQAGTDVSPQTGNFSWNITGQYDVVSGNTTSSALTIRWKQTGTYTATVTYNQNGMTVSSKITVNVVIPTLTSFTATQHEDLLGWGAFCGYEGYLWSLGCKSLPGAEGINFSATAQVPSSSYLSDPAQSGIKYVQAVSSFHKYLYSGTDQFWSTPPPQPHIPLPGPGTFFCLTARNSENGINSGWRYDNGPNDSGDPYDVQPDALHYFSQGSSITIVTRDSPAVGFTDIDALKVDDQFQMYVVYFAGGTPSSPNFQQRLGSLSWNWGGQLVFDSTHPTGSTPYSKHFLYAQPGTRNRDSVTSNILPQGRNTDIPYAPCPSGPPPSHNPIDGAAVFVWWQYYDILGRTPDQGGWDFWRSQISFCDFDTNCIWNQRVSVARAFFDSAEFQQIDPDMANPPGTPGFNPQVYNPAFVRHCYLSYLRRPPDDGGLNFWVDNLNQYGNYNALIAAFINSSEYRNRFAQ